MKLIVGFLVVLVVGVSLAFVCQRELAEGTSQGALFSDSHPLGDCVQESLNRMPAETGFAGRMRLLAFARACLQQAQADDAFCSQIPATILDAADWIGSECSHFEADQKTCEKIYQYTVSACVGQLPGMTPREEANYAK